MATKEREYEADSQLGDDANGWLEVEAQEDRDNAHFYADLCAKVAARIAGAEAYMKAYDGAYKAVYKDAYEESMDDAPNRRARAAETEDAAAEHGPHTPRQVTPPAPDGPGKVRVRTRSAGKAQPRALDLGADEAAPA